MPFINKPEDWFEGKGLFYTELPLRLLKVLNSEGINTRYCQSTTGDYKIQVTRQGDFLVLLHFSKKLYGSRKKGKFIV
jgi:hypothetical protein